MVQKLRPERHFYREADTTRNITYLHARMVIRNSCELFRLQAPFVHLWLGIWVLIDLNALPELKQLIKLTKAQVMTSGIININQIIHSWVNKRADFAEVKALLECGDLD